MARQKVQDPIAQGGVETQVPTLMMSLVGTMVLNAELLTMNSILT